MGKIYPSFGFQMLRVGKDTMITGTTNFTARGISLFWFIGEGGHRLYPSYGVWLGSTDTGSPYYTFHMGEGVLCHATYYSLG